MEAEFSVTLLRPAARCATVRCMLRQLRDWWPFLRQPVLIAAYFAALILLQWPLGGFVLMVFVAGVLAVGPAITISLTIRQRRWLWRLVRSAWRFQTVRNPRVVLRFESRRHSDRRLQKIARVCENQLDDLAVRFGFSLRRAVTVFLLRDADEVTHVYGRRCAGFAIVQANAIVIAPTRNLTPEELIRHELVHLFAGRWGPLKPALNSEGLAVWLQATEGGVPIDVAALTHLRHRGLRLPAMLKTSFFRDPCREHACYLLAGTFAGFLIDRYGWRAYRRFYRTVASWGCYRWVLRRHFGISLERAEKEWRNKLIVPEVLRRRARNMV
jgi:hypothetical protein